ncbi:MAG: cobalamin B12-binding domain-containing protein [Elusimicrobia bacterium]|nr:cobalamin B12-binding domain-containing protein [Elusimicrobiota bacterium]
MKVLLVYPRFRKYRQSCPELAALPAAAAAWEFTMPPSLAIPTLAAVTPGDAELRVWDQNVQDQPAGWEPDLVAVSYFTPQAFWAHELADRFRREGKAVVLGGLHPTMAPGDAAPHADAVCVGEGDELWPRILADFGRGELRPRYEGPPPERPAAARREVFDRSKYTLDADIVSFTRGCPYGCSWCAIPSAQGPRLRLRPAEDVAAELRSLAGRRVFAADDAILLPRPDVAAWTLDVLGRLGGASVGLFLSGSPAMNRDGGFLDALARAGTRSVYVVFGDDPASRAFYAGDEAAREAAAALVRLIEGRGMRFFASFGLGYDGFGPEQFDRVLEWCGQSGVRLAEFFVATPYPGTPFWKRLEASGRLDLPADWRLYNGSRAVFRPERLSREALDAGFARLWKEFYRGRDPGADAAWR